MFSLQKWTTFMPPKLGDCQTMHYNVGFMGHTMNPSEVRGETMLIRVTLGVTNPLFTFLKKL
jgi:hypothetical protein